MKLDIKKVDWNALKKITDPKAAGDLNAFLEKLPQNAGQTVLIAAGIAWAMAGALGLYTSMQARQLAELRAELNKNEALSPIVPKLTETPMPKEQIDAFVEKAKEAYPLLSITGDGTSIKIASGQTSNFASFREAVGHVQNGGQGWRVGLESLCVGRECAQDKLSATLKVSKVTVEIPPPPAEAVPAGEVSVENPAPAPTPGG